MEEIQRIINDILIRELKLEPGYEYDGLYNAPGYYWASEELGVDILNKEEISWKTKYPNIEKRLFNLERSIEALEGSLKSNNKSKD